MQGRHDKMSFLARALLRLYYTVGIPIGTPHVEEPMSLTLTMRRRHVNMRFLARALLVLSYTVVIPTGMPHAEEPMPLTITSNAFTDGGQIPARYTCQGTDVSPPLAWSGVPATARSLVLIVDDPDAPDPKAPRMTWVHWVLFNLPPQTTGLPEGVAPNALPAGTGQGTNSWNRAGYGGPCPPIGRHRYFHKLYALDAVLDFAGTPTEKAVEAALRGHVIEEAQLVGTYQKSR
jgi:Raf kinase inhibitor-like YbhB/YbcL family protein